MAERVDESTDVWSITPSEDSSSTTSTSPRSEEKERYIVLDISMADMGMGEESRGRPSSGMPSLSGISVGVWPEEKAEMDTRENNVTKLNNNLFITYVFFAKKRKSLASSKRSVKITVTSCVFSPKLTRWYSAGFKKSGFYATLYLVIHLLEV